MNLIDVTEHANPNLGGTKHSVELISNDEYLISEAIISQYPKLKRAFNLHIEITTTDQILNHIPIDGVVIHLNSAGNTPVDIDEFIRKLSVKWCKTIKYLRICSGEQLYCTICNDRISKPHPSFKSLRISRLMNDYYRHMAKVDTNIVITSPPQDIIDIDRQLILEGSCITSRSIVYLPKFVDFPYDENIVSSIRVTTPLWMLYYILHQLKAVKVAGDIISYRISYFKSEYRHLACLIGATTNQTLTLYDMMQSILYLFRPYVVPSCYRWITSDIVLRAILDAETIYYGHQISLQIA